jgi:ribonuclease BN (tRNA processing enzyme)
MHLLSPELFPSFQSVDYVDSRSSCSVSSAALSSLPSSPSSSLASNIIRGIPLLKFHLLNNNKNKKYNSNQVEYSAKATTQEDALKLWKAASMDNKPLERSIQHAHYLRDQVKKKETKILRSDNHDQSYPNHDNHHLNQHQPNHDHNHRICFLGTGCAIPSKYRNVSSVLLQLNNNKPNSDAKNHHVMRNSGNHSDSSIRSCDKNGSSSSNSSSRSSSSSSSNSSRDDGRVDMMLIDAGESTWAQLLRMAYEYPDLISNRNSTSSNDDIHDDDNNDGNNDNIDVSSSSSRGNVSHSSDINDICINSGSSYIYGSNSICRFDSISIKLSLAKQLKVIWISHPHADHHLGLTRIIIERKTILQQQQLPLQQTSQLNKNQYEATTNSEEGCGYDRVNGDSSFGHDDVDDDGDDDDKHYDENKFFPKFTPLIVIAPPSVLSFLHNYEQINTYIIDAYIPVSCRQYDPFDACDTVDCYWKLLLSEKNDDNRYDNNNSTNLNRNDTDDAVNDDHHSTDDVDKDDDDDDDGINVDVDGNISNGHRKSYNNSYETMKRKHNLIDTINTSHCISLNIDDDNDIRRSSSSSSRRGNMQVKKSSRVDESLILLTHKEEGEKDDDDDEVNIKSLDDENILYCYDINAAAATTATTTYPSSSFNYLSSSSSSYVFYQPQLILSQYFKKSLAKNKRIADEILHGMNIRQLQNVQVIHCRQSYGLCLHYNKDDDGCDDSDDANVDDDHNNDNQEDDNTDYCTYYGRQNKCINQRNKYDNRYRKMNDADIQHHQHHYHHDSVRSKILPNRSNNNNDKSNNDNNNKHYFKLVYSGDTRPCDLLSIIGYNATILIHEATFEDSKSIEAMNKKHSTISEAMKISRDMNAYRTILTHFSQRYPSIPILPSDITIDYSTENHHMFNVIDNTTTSTTSTFEATTTDATTTSTVQIVDGTNNTVTVITNIPIPTACYREDSNNTNNNNNNNNNNQTNNISICHEYDNNTLTSNCSISTKALITIPSPPPILAFDFMHINFNDLSWLPYLTNAFALAYPSTTNEENDVITE